MLRTKTVTLSFVDRPRIIFGAEKEQNSETKLVGAEVGAKKFFEVIVEVGVKVFFKVLLKVWTWVAVGLVGADAEVGVTVFFKVLKKVGVSVGLTGTDDDDDEVAI